MIILTIIMILLAIILIAIYDRNDFLDKDALRTPIAFVLGLALFSSIVHFALLKSEKKYVMNDENKYFVLTKCEQFDAESNKYTIEFIDNEAYFIKKISFIDDKNKYNIGDIIDFTKKNEDNFNEINKKYE